MTGFTDLGAEFFGGTWLGSGSMENAPIGILDSGFGDLTVARAIMDKLPDEQILYLGDTAHMSYDPRPIAEVRRYTLACLDELASYGVKTLVIACNTATAVALSDVRERYWIDAYVPVIEVIIPAVRQAIATTRNHRIGVIGAFATIQSEAYKNALGAVPELNVVQQACPGFIEFVERGITMGAELETVTREYLQPLKEAEADTVILGCTHYPLLTGVVARIIGERVSLVTSSEAAANAAYNELTDRDPLCAPWARGRGPAHELLTTGESDNFPRLARHFLGPEVARAQEITVDAGARA